MERDKNIYSINLIVENSVYNSISVHVICPICNELKLDPKISTCSKDCQFSVCGECSKKINTCPICRGPPNWKNCLIIKQLLSSLDFKCNICNHIIRFDDLKEHYANKHIIDINKIVIICRQKTIAKKKLITMFCGNYQ